jgi:hypothetical protein
MDRRRRGEVELHGGLHAGLVAGGDQDAIETAVTQLGAFGLDDVLAGIERGKAVSAVFGRGGAHLCAGCLVVEEDGNSSQRGRVEVGEFSDEGTCGSGLCASGPSRAEKKHGNRQRLHPDPLHCCHRDTCSRQNPGESTQNTPPARSGGGSGFGQGRKCSFERSFGRSLNTQVELHRILFCFGFGGK